MVKPRTPEGQRLRAARERAELQIRDVVKRTGITRGSVYNHEMRGVRSGVTLGKYAVAYGVTVAELRGAAEPGIVSRATLSKVGDLLVAAAKVDVAWRAFQDQLRDYAARHGDEDGEPGLPASAGPGPALAATAQPGTGSPTSRRPRSG